MDIRTIRKRLGMTQRQFAEEFHILHRTLQKWELGERPCPEYLLRLIADKAERMAGVTLVLDRSDAENLHQLLRDMSGYMIGAALGNGGAEITDETVEQTQSSVLRAFAQLDRELARTADAE